MQARNFTTNVPKNLDVKSSSEQIFSLKLPLGAPDLWRVSSGTELDNETNHSCYLWSTSGFHTRISPLPLYVNDLPEVISSSSRVLMFADDTKIFREIKTLGDASSLQEDLGKLATWSQSSGLLFNEAKCKAQHITRKTKPTLSSYELNNTAKIYLGVWISKDLTWYKQVNEQSSRANKLLGYLKKNTRFILRTEVRRTLYLALVRPHLGYATQIWAPQSIELIVKLERIQRRATKFILKLPHSSNISYKSRLQSLNLQ